MLVHIIADYGFGDLAFAEVVQRLKVFLPDAEPMLTPVPAFATLAAGFCIAQLGLNDSPAGTIIYHNVAPREDDEQARAGNAGERLAFARLPTGVRVIGVNPMLWLRRSPLQTYPMCRRTASPTLMATAI